MIIQPHQLPWLCKETVNFLDRLAGEVSECRAWKQELEERAISKGLISREDLEGERPDWDGWFLNWNSKFIKERERRKK